MNTKALLKHSHGIHHTQTKHSENTLNRPLQKPIMLKIVQKNRGHTKDMDEINLEVHGPRYVFYLLILI